MIPVIGYLSIKLAIFPKRKLIMEILMNFYKPSISKNVGKFLLENLKTEKEKESLDTVIRGKKLVYGDANTLLRSLLQAMKIADNQVVEEFVE